MMLPSPSVLPILLGLLLTKTSYGEDGTCSGMTPCDTAGATCTEGTETCCGVTYPSLECNCQADGSGGGLTWLCRATDSCMLPCETIAPVPARTPITRAPVVVASTLAIPVREDGTCSSMTPCDTAGATCTEGTETCCGVTYPSLECNCQDDGSGGDLTWLCRATDSCMLPCETIAPVPARTPITRAPVVVASTLAIPVREDGTCSGMTPCDTAGATCTEGTETCCGVTYPSLECDCQDDGSGGDLTWLCRATDSCILPCETIAPVPARTPITRAPIVVTNDGAATTIGSPNNNKPPSSAPTKAGPPPTTAAPSMAEDVPDLSDDSGAKSLVSLGIMGSCTFAVVVALVWSF